MCSFWISSMVPMVRVLLLAKAKLVGKKNHGKHGETARTSLSSTSLRIRNSWQAHLSGYPSELRGHM